MNWKNAILALALILALGFLIWLLLEKSRSAGLARDLERLRYSSNQTGDQLAEARSERDRLSRQISDRDREISQLRADNEGSARAAKRAADSLQRDVDSLRSRESEAQAEIDKHRQASEAAAKELAAAQSRLEELETSLTGNAVDPASGAEYQALVSSRDEARARLDSLTADLDQARAENEKMRLAAEAAAQELAAADSRAQELEKRLKEAEAAARPESDFQALISSEAAARSQIESLTKAEAEARAQVEDLNIRLDQARSEIERLEKESAERPEPGPPVDPAENKSEDDPGARSELEDLRRELESGRAAQGKLVGELLAAQVQTADVLEKATAETAQLKEDLSQAVQAERETRARLTDCQKDSAGHQARTEGLEAEKKALRDSVAAVFVDQLLFNSGSVALSGAGMEVLDRAAKVVNQSPDRAVVVVGHSDDQAPGRQLSRYYPSNWELSAARAAAVVRHLTEKGGVDPIRLSLVGRSHYQPAVQNESDEDRRKNRRVEIIISNQLRSAVETP